MVSGNMKTNVFGMRYAKATRQLNK